MISVIGGAINSNHLKELLKSTYSKKKEDIGDYKIDRKLSGLRAKVFTNKETGKNIIAMRGTKGIHDVITDGHLFFGNKNTKRFKHAQKVYDRVVSKYGKDNLILAGHSLSGQLVEKIGRKNKDEIYTLNKPVTPVDILKGQRVPKNQTDIRTSNDVVSILRPFQKGKKEITIPSDSLNLLDEHKTDKLEKLNGVMIGGKLYNI
jgi:hypothetical protein